jgi:hypothetical protein
VAVSIPRTATTASTASRFGLSSKFACTSFARARRIQARPSAPRLARGNEHLQ